MGGARVRACGSCDTNRISVLVLAVSPVAEASRWSSVCTPVNRQHPYNPKSCRFYLVARFKTQPKLVRTLYLPVPAKFVANGVAQRNALVIGERSGGTL